MHICIPHTKPQLSANCLPFKNTSPALIELHISLKKIDFSTLNFKMLGFSSMWGCVVSPHRQKASLAPAGCPTLQLKSDTIYQRQHQIPQVRCSVLQDCPALQRPIIDPLATDWRFPWPPPATSDANCKSQLLPGLPR